MTVNDDPAASVYEAFFRLRDYPDSLDMAAALASARVTRMIDEAAEEARQHINRSVGQHRRRMRERWEREDAQREQFVVILDPVNDAAKQLRDGYIGNVSGFTIHEGSP